MNRENRRSLLAKVHIAAKDLGMSTEQYRQMLRDRFGVESAKDLKQPELAALVRHMAALGWQAKPGRTPGFVKIPESDPLCRQKRYALGLAKSLGWKLSGLNKRIKTQFGVESLLWLRDQHAMQTLIKDMRNRCQNKGIDPRPRPAA